MNFTRISLLVLILSLVAFIAIPAISTAQSGTPLLKIVVDENGKARVFDMEGNEVVSTLHKSEPEQKTESEKKEITTVHLSAAEQDNTSTKDKIHQKFKNSNTIIGKGVQQVKIPENSLDPEVANYLKSLQKKTVSNINNPLKSEPSATEANEFQSQTQIKSTTPSTSVVPKNLMIDSSLEAKGKVESGVSTQPPIPINILDSNNPEAKLHVEEKQLEKKSPTPGPNLTAVAANCSFSYSSPNLTVNVRVQNNGSSSAGVTSVLGYYLSTNTTITYLDYLIGSDLVNALSPGSYNDETVTVNLTTVGALPAGTYYVAFIIDLNNEVIEDNEGDNAWYWSSPTIYTTGGPTAPNLSKRASYTDYFNYSGTTLSIYTSVINYGNAWASYSYVGYYLSTNTIISTIDNLIDTDYVPGLDPNHYSDVSTSVDLNTVSGLPAGTYYVGYIIDYTYRVSESNGWDNYWHWNSPTITYPTGQPNLTAVPANCSYSFTDPNLTINVRVINNGTVSAHWSYVGYYLSDNTTITTGDYRIGSDYVSGLGVGSWSDETINVNVQTVSATPSLPNGTHTYYIGFIVDYRNDEPNESNEGDNAWYWSTTITFTRGQPNLTAVPANCSYSFTDPNLTINVRVINNGTISAHWSYVGYYLSDNTTITTADYRIGSDYVSGLGVGSWNDVTINVNVQTVSATPALPNGTHTYYVGFIVDYRNDEPNESNEGDNAWYWPTTITFTRGQPNLTAVPASCSYSFSDPMLTINVRVINNGNVTAGASILGYYLSNNTTISTGDYRIGTDAVGSLAVGAWSDQTITVNVQTVSATPSLPNGTHTYYVAFIIDYLNSVGESNEGDNAWYFSPTITFTRGQPNLTAVPASCSYSFSDPTLTINVRVINNGNVTAGASTLGYYLSDNTTITTADYRIGTDAVGSLAVGAWSDQTITVNVQTVSATPSLPNGTHTYYVAFIIDYLNAVGESNEGDNAWYFSPTITFTRGLFPEWAVPINISGTTSFTRTFGGHTSATDGFDSGLDVQTAPPGMTYYAYFSIAVFPNYLDTDIRGWVSPYNTNIDWTLRLVNATAVTSNLSWNTSDVPSQGSFTLTGSGLNVDMRSVGSATVSGDATLTIQYRSTVPVTYNFAGPGWYLISLPVTPADNSLSTLFPTALAAYGYNSATGSYFPTSTLDIKKGYWLLIPSAAVATVSGAPLTSFTEHYTTGWHLIGSVLGTGHPYADPDDSPAGSVIATYGWNPTTNTYFQVYPAGTGVLDEMEGYWLAVVSPCDLTIPGAPPLSKTTVPDEADMEAFYQQFGSQPPVPPFIADKKLGQMLSPKNRLSYNYPNPFNPETVIEYSLEKTGLTRVYVYNTLGQRIRTLVEDQQVAGIHQVVWNGQNDNGELVPSGIYFYSIITSEFEVTRKMLLLK